MDNRIAFPETITGYRMTDHKRNEYIRKELGITDVNKEIIKGKW
jgi:hypothetical protein